MRIFALVTSLFLAAAFAAEAPLEDAAIRKTIQEFSSDEFSVREAASTTLKKLGDPIVPILKDVLAREKDPETRQRLNELVALWPTGGNVWQFEAGYVFGLPVVDGGRVYVGNKDMNFFCLDLESGKVLWKTPLEGMMYHSPAVADGRVYVIRTRKGGVPDGTLICLDAKDGSQLWTFHSEDSQTFTSPMVSDGKLFLANDDVLFCLDAVKGTKVWEYSAPRTILSAPSISDGKVLVGSLDHKLHCVSVADGKQLWEFETGDSVYAGAAIAGGRAYLGSHDNCLYSLDLKTGAKLWELKATGRIAHAPAYANGQLFFACDDGTLTCVNAKSGQRTWVYNAAGTPCASPSVSGSRVYLVTIFDEMRMNCLGLDGRPDWTYTTKEAGYASPVLVGRRMLIGYHSTFFCIRTSAPGPENWPMTGGNAARTNCNDK
jgi:outer membrane protein assembly factor BamB